MEHQSDFQTFKKSHKHQYMKQDIPDPSSKETENTFLIFPSSRKNVKNYGGIQQYSTTPQLNEDKFSSICKTKMFCNSIHKKFSKKIFNKTFEDEDHKNLNGEHIWYDNYNAIDWIHDTIKDATRAKKLRSIKGIRGWIRNTFDASQGWILVFFTGFITSCVAYVIDVVETIFFDWKFGYCSVTLILLTFITDNIDDLVGCKQWNTWGKHFNFPRKQQWIIDYLVYIAIALLFALISVQLTMTTRTTFPVSMENSSENLSQNISIKKKNNSRAEKVAYMASGSGIPEVKTILSGFTIHKFLGFRTLVVKVIGLTLSVASGLNLGKEGPFVHIACCIGNIACRLFNKYNYNDGKRRELLSAASAAGVAVAFGAPIGGVLFSLEEVSYFFPSKTMWRSFFCAMVAAITLKILNPYGTGKVVLLETHYSHEWHSLELFIFLFLGLFGGLYGSLFCKLNIHWAKTFRRLSFIKKHPIFEVFIVTLFTAIISYHNPYTKLGGTELVSHLLKECNNNELNEGLCPENKLMIPKVTILLILALIIKGSFTIVTFGTKIPAGIFIPTMAIGALFGRFVGLIVQFFYYTYPSAYIFSRCPLGDPNECIVPGVYSMVGAAATLAGVTRMTVSLAVIMFELTGSLSYVMPFMLSILVSKWVADAIEPQGIYDLLIDLNEYPYLDTKSKYTFSSYLSELLPPPITVYHTTIDLSFNSTVSYTKLRDMLKYVKNEGYIDGGFPIVYNKTLIGYIAAHELEHALDTIKSTVSNEDIEKIGCYLMPFGVTDSTSSLDTGTSYSLPDPADLRSYVDKAPISLNKEAPMELVFEMFSKLGLRYLCILDGAEFVGVVHKKRFVRYLKEIEKGLL
ncbi:hypothetical protein PNEG_00222 [Pneumocystis murina B123]|uniref:Chloride channel protein n=1 Tax=Pneumocystis murina (strain B123) TaxID=1069680 RepID=M7NXB2_PNEMU|nr:hypothetical protein PNEG_00222 [Pneumocystis murina B123]EMR11796.1 hypothetical protein PNEG_00222 [Pneumocystis murina B123]